MRLATRLRGIGRIFRRSFCTNTRTTSVPIQGGRKPLEITVSEGAFSLTPASRITLQTVNDLMDKWKGVGLDWGTGSGLLALACAQSAAVDKMYGFDIEEENVSCARLNAQDNGLSNKTEFVRADSFTPFEEADRARLADITFDFIIANPPASDLTATDGFEFRRLVLNGAKSRVKPGGFIVLQALSYYGQDRVSDASDAAGDMQYLGVASSTEWVHLFDSPDAKSILEPQLEGYVRAEQRGGLPYQCHPRDPESKDSELMSAEETLAFVRGGGEPLCKWQTHLFQRDL